MSNDYPTQAELTRIRKWSSSYDFMDFMAYVKSVGKYWPKEGFGWRQRGRVFWVSTGGWSGNEDILYALKDNHLFWSLCWISTHRGGHYKFHVPKLKRKPHV